MSAPTTMLSREAAEQTPAQRRAIYAEAQRKALAEQAAAKALRDATATLRWIVGASDSPAR